MRPNLKEISNIELQNLIDKMWNTLPILRPDIEYVLNKVNIIYDDTLTKKKQSKCNVM
jgi:hypothetical protein